MKSEEISSPPHSCWASARRLSVELKKYARAYEELFNMEYFLICTNSKCRFIVNLREGVQVLERSKLVIDERPECGHPWSSDCPFCGRPLEATGQGNLSRCLRCNRELRPDADVDPTVR